MTLAELCRFLPSHLVKVQGDQLLPDLSHQLRILESLRLLLFVAFATEKQKCAWENLMATGIIKWGWDG